MLYLNLQHIFRIRHIERPYTFLVKIGIAPHTATKILSSNVYIMRLNHIEMICRALYCEPNDLLAFKQETNNPLPESHPLLNLLPNDENSNWQEQLKTMPLAKLNKISKMLNQTNDSVIE